MPSYSRRQFLKTSVTGAMAILPWLYLACSSSEKFDVLITGGLVYDGVEVDWLDFTGYFQRLEKGGIITNVASMVGQGLLRESVVVNGEVVIERGEFNGKLAGKVLRAPYRK